jgi:hypothetical protein
MPPKITIKNHNQKSQSKITIKNHNQKSQSKSTTATTPNKPIEDLTGPGQILILQQRESKAQQLDANPS